MRRSGRAEAAAEGIDRGMGMSETSLPCGSTSEPVHQSWSPLPKTRAGRPRRAAHACDDFGVSARQSAVVCATDALPCPLGPPSPLSSPVSPATHRPSPKTRQPMTACTGGQGRCDQLTNAHAQAAARRISHESDTVLTLARGPCVEEHKIHRYVVLPTQTMYAQSTVGTWSDWHARKTWFQTAISAARHSLPLAPLSAGGQVDHDLPDIMVLYK